jgi:hypothetical protein
MTFQPFIMENTSKFPNEMIHITLRGAMQLHGHQNNVVPLMKPFISVDFNNDVNFYNCTC